MSKKYSVEALIVALERAWIFAVQADLGQQYAKKIDELIALAKEARE